MSLEPIVKSGNQVISIRVVIDTDSLPVCPDPAEDTPIPTIACEQGYMIVTSTALTVVENQGRCNVTFAARANDTVRFFATSGSNNFGQSVLIKDISHSEGDQILHDFKTVSIEREHMVPTSNPSVFTTQIVKRDFWPHECKVASEGTGSYSLKFALYDRDEQGKPSFTGLYQWNAQITIRFSPPLETNTQNQENIS